MRRPYTWGFVPVITAISSCLTSYATAEEKPGIKAAYKLFDAMDMANSYQQTLSKIVDVKIQGDPKIAPYRGVILEFFNKYLGWDSMKADIAQIYSENFTTKELIQLKKFYQTPIGKKAANLIPKLTAEGAALGQKRVQENMGELRQLITQEEQKLNAKKEVGF